MCVLFSCLSILALISIGSSEVAMSPSSSCKCLNDCRQARPVSQLSLLCIFPSPSNRSSQPPFKELAHSPHNTSSITIVYPCDWLLGAYSSFRMFAPAK